MGTWYVRPNTTHSATRTGVTYNSAWGGWSEIVWGGSGVAAGDTLYVCDTHTYAEILTVGGQVATPSARITVRGDYASHPGVITFTSGAYYIDANRNYMTFTELTMNSGGDACISPGGAPNIALQITNNVFNCGSQPAIKFRAFNLWSYEDTLIDGNSFSGGSAPLLGGCIQWYVTGVVTSSLKRLTISNNTFSGNLGRASVMLKALYGTANDACTIADLIVHDNVWQDCYGVALEAECKKNSGGVPIGACTGIKIYGNRITNQGLNGTLGGGFVPSGFEQSTTVDFGFNDIYDNWASGLHGLTGFCNPLYGTYRIFSNYAENITTIDIDGCGVLPDHGCHDTAVFGNTFKDIHGDGSATYTATGFGILILDAYNITCYGNLIINCQVGIGYGNKNSSVSSLTQSSDIYNNTFANCAQHAVYMVGGGSNTTNSARNNVFTSTKSLAAVQVDSAAWTGESRNCFYGFGAPVNHTIAVSSITTDPKLDSDKRLKDGSPAIATGIYIRPTAGVDRKTMWNPPSMGAFEYVRPRSTRA